MTPIIIFGAAMRPDGSPSPALARRVAAAARFGAGIADAVFIPTGGQGRFGPPEWQAMAALLAGHGVAADRVRPEPSATDTLDSVLACRAMLAGHTGVVWAASSRFHLPRCLVLLWLAGLRARPVPIEGSTERRWWKRWYWRLREVPATGWDVLLMVWWRVRGRPSG
jgi:vancomycin permeability regulator SanA